MYNDDEDLRELEDAIARGVQKGLYGPPQDVPPGCQTVGVLSIFGGLLAVAWVAGGFGMMLAALAIMVVTVGLMVAIASLFD